MFRIPDSRGAAAGALAAIALSGCVAYGGGTTRPYPHPHRALDIPKGHLPPPGECRIWFRDVPPGQQPPPGDCRDLERRVPPGAVLVRG